MNNARGVLVAVVNKSILICILNNRLTQVVTKRRNNRRLKLFINVVRYARGYRACKICTKYFRFFSVALNCLLLYSLFDKLMF